MEFRPAGDRAVAVQFAEAISPEVNRQVRALEHLIRARRPAGILETVPTFRALLVYYDPLVLGWDGVCARLVELARAAEGVELPAPRAIELPCCYDPELGPDLEAAAARLGITPDEVARLHAGAGYTVYFIGFTPGLPYLGGLPPALQLPRLETPRTHVPAGSVGVGGIQCCVYSVDSPGGYWLLGRTPLRLYDPGAARPVLLEAGDVVRFSPIDRAEYDALAGSRGRRADGPVASSGSAAG